MGSRQIEPPRTRRNGWTLWPERPVLFTGKCLSEQVESLPPTRSPQTHSLLDPLNESPSSTTTNTAAETPLSTGQEDIKSVMHWLYPMNPPLVLQPGDQTHSMVNGLPLRCAFLIQYYPIITHSCTHSHIHTPAAESTKQVDSQLVGSSGGELSCSGTPRHPARRSRGSN